MPNFALPPLHRGLPLASLQMGPSSSQVGGPTPTPYFSGILSNLVHQGVIKLEPPSQPQVLLMHVCILLWLSNYFYMLLILQFYYTYKHVHLGLCWS
jgi:hypothetical protein